MTTAEYVEQVCEIKLTQYQKDYMDYLDEHPDTKVTIPRGRGVITGYELWILGWVSRMAEVKFFELGKEFGND
jgi:hypothetical protein